MNVAEMTKEQKQYIVLGVVVGATGVFALFNFLLAPMKAKYAAAKEEYAQVSADLDAARRVIRNEDAIREQLARSTEILAEAATEYLPDTLNPLSWATQKIYFKAREVGVEVTSVSETGGSGVLQSQAHGGHRAFGSYSVRVLTECGYDKLVQLMDALETSNPYLTVTGVTVDARPGSPLNHPVNLVVEWPICLDPATAARIAETRGENHG